MYETGGKDKNIVRKTLVEKIDLVCKNGGVKMAIVCYLSLGEVKSTTKVSISMRN